MRLIDESHFIEKEYKLSKIFKSFGMLALIVAGAFILFGTNYSFLKSVYLALKAILFIWFVVGGVILISIPIYKILLYFRKDSYIYSIDEYDPGLKVELLNGEKLDLDYKNLVWVRETLPGKIRLWDQVSNRQFVFTNKLTDENGKTTLEVEGKSVGIFKHVAQEIVDRLEGKQI